MRRPWKTSVPVSSSAIATARNDGETRSSASKTAK
jgi:hypothetical protein